LADSTFFPRIDRKRVSLFFLEQRSGLRLSCGPRSLPVYATAIWLASLAVFTVQRAISWREAGLSKGDVTRRVAQILATPTVALAAVVILITVAHLTQYGVTPDWTSYLRRTPAAVLPLDTTGSVWYLVLLFALLSMIAVLTFAHDPMDSRLVPLAGLWAGFWAVAGFFVATNEPVRAAALVPLLLFILAIALRLMRSDRTHRWHRIVVAALVPAFAIPITTGARSCTVHFRDDAATGLAASSFGFATMTDREAAAPKASGARIPESGGAALDSGSRALDHSARVSIWRRDHSALRAGRAAGDCRVADLHRRSFCLSARSAVCRSHRSADPTGVCASGCRGNRVLPDPRKLVGRSVGSRAFSRHGVVRLQARDGRSHRGFRKHRSNDRWSGCVDERRLTRFLD
jgi:hypothetical protein